MAPLPGFGHQQEQGQQQEGQQSAADLQAENADLRQQLEEENQGLRERLAATRAENPSEALTDEDIRRIEHPDEFAHENQPTVAAADDGDR